MSIDQQDASSPTIQMCPNEEQIPFSMVPHELLRDASISPNCIWLICYLLSNSPGWVIKIAQVARHVKEFIGRDKVYKILDEALDSGYMKREEFKEGNFTRYRYFVSRTRKFKKCYQLPDFQDTEIQDTENQGSKEEHVLKDQSKSMLLGNEVPVSIEKEENQKQASLVKDDVHAYCIRTKQNWSSQEIDEAWAAFKKILNPITEPYEYIKGIIKKKRNSAQIKKDKEKSCLKNHRRTQPLKELSQTTNSKHLVVAGMSDGILAKFSSLQRR